MAKTIHSFEQHAEQELAALREELLGGRFVPQPYKQVNIPKKDGDIRSLGLMTIRDKIVQQSARGVLEPSPGANVSGCQLRLPGRKGHRTGH